MYTTVVIGGILLIVALVGVAMWCCYRAGDDNGYQRRINDEKQRLADDRQAERARTGRHARTQPRTAIVKDTGTKRAHLPIPGPPRPQPARTSEPGTAILPKHGSIAEALDVAGVRPRLGPFNTTGEQRAITDDFIAAQQADNAAWLEQWSAV